MSDVELERDFDDWMSGEIDETGDVPVAIPAEDDPYWQPTTDEGIERILRGRSRRSREVAQTETFVKGQIDRMKAFGEDRTRGARRWIEMADRALEGFARKTHGAHPEGRVWKLPSGSFRLSKPQESLQVDDEQTAGAYLAKLDLEGVVSFAVAKGELKKATVAVPYPDDDYPPCACPHDPLPSHLDGPVRVHSDDCPVHGPREWLQVATLDGEVIPGVHYTRPRTHTFSPPK